jgi:hypothetical protein
LLRRLPISMKIRVMWLEKPSILAVENVETM